MDSIINQSTLDAPRPRFLNYREVIRRQDGFKLDHFSKTFDHFRNFEIGHLILTVECAETLGQRMATGDGVGIDQMESVLVIWVSGQ